MQTPNRLPITTFLNSVELQNLDKPLILDFKPRFDDINDTYQEIRRHGHGERDTQYLRSIKLCLGDLIEGGARLERAIDTQSALNINSGSWLSWPGMITDFHRDWNLWSALNFMLCGRKIWYLLDSSHVLPRHANLVFGDTTSIIANINAGKYGYKAVQTDNQCIYIPDGYYHRVATESFSMSYTMWWTWRDRLRRRKSLIDPWWLNNLSHQKYLKTEYAPTVRCARNDRSLFDRVYCRYIYRKYLRICNRFNAREILEFHSNSKAAADHMKSLLAFETFDEAKRAAEDISGKKEEIKI